MFSFNLISIENLFSFSFKRKNRASSSDIFFSVQFEKSLLTQSELINSIKEIESSLVIDDGFYSTYDMHLDSYIMASEYNLIHNGLISASSYLQTLKSIQLWQNYTRKEYGFYAIEAVGSMYRGNKNVDDAFKALKIRFFEFMERQGKLDHRRLELIRLCRPLKELTAKTSIEDFEKLFDCRISIIKDEYRKTIGVSLQMVK